VGGRARAAEDVGYARHHLGDHARALACFQQAIGLLSDIGGRHVRAIAQSHLGDTRQAMGNHQAARDTWREALVILAEVDPVEA